MKDDLDKYISRRKKRDGKFAESFESGYQELKVGAFATRPETPLAVENSVGKLAANQAPNVSAGKRAWRTPIPRIVPA